MKAFIITLGISCVFLQAEPMVNMCEKAYVMESQNNYVKIRKVLNRNDRVEVIQKSNTEGSLPVWAKTQEGYVSFKCLVSEEDFKNIQKGDIRKSSGNDTKIAKKGFSESESGDGVAMKGAAGSAKMGRANYQALSKLSNYYVANPIVEFEAFRKEAKLGEYK